MSGALPRGWGRAEGIKDHTAQTNDNFHAIARRFNAAAARTLSAAAGS
jgi:hypothetical protein